MELCNLNWLQNFSLSKITWDKRQYGNMWHLMVTHKIDILKCHKSFLIYRGKDQIALQKDVHEQTQHVHLLLTDYKQTYLCMIHMHRHTAVFLLVKQQQQSRAWFVSLVFVSWTLWCHQTPGPTETLNESQRNSQLHSSQEIAFKNIILSLLLTHFPSRHANTETCIRPYHLPHKNCSLRPSSCTKTCEPKELSKCVASSHLKTSSAFKLKTHFSNSLLFQRFRESFLTHLHGSYNIVTAYVAVTVTH